MTQDHPLLGVRMLRGIELQLWGQAAVAVVTFLVTPRIVHYLGPENYALYSWMGTILGYLMLLTAGTGAAAQRFTAYHRGRNEAGTLSALLCRTLAFHVVVAVTGATALHLLRGWIAVHIFHAQGQPYEAALRVISTVAAATPAYFIFQFSLCVLHGMQRFGLYNVFSSLQTILALLSAMAALWLGRGAPVTAAFFALSYWVLAVAAFFAVRGALAEPAYELGTAELSDFRWFSVKSLLSQLVWTATFLGDRLFVNQMLSLSLLSYYVISSSLVQKFNIFCSSVSSTTLPIFTELHGQGDEKRLRRLYLKASELSLFFILFALVMAFVFAPQFFTLWLGTEFSSMSTWPFRLLLLANTTYVLCFLANAVAVSKGLPELAAVSQAIKVVIMVALWRVLIPRYGLSGAASGTMIAELLTIPPFIWYVNRRFFGLGWGEFIGQAYARPAAAGAGLLVVLLPLHDRVSNWLDLIAFSVGGALVYMALGYALLDQDAKNTLYAWLKPHPSGWTA